MTSKQTPLHVFLNPKANRGKAQAAWERIAPVLEDKGWLVEPSMAPTREELTKNIQTAIKSGASFLATAGGDGTLQTLLDAVMSDPATCGNVTIGAIGIGTSNDFHKPLSPDRMIAGAPCRLNRESARPHDVIKFEATTPDGRTTTRYLLQSSHVGTIPSANVRLTMNPGIFKILYHIWYKAALMAVSAVELFSYPGFSGEITCGTTTWKGLFSGMSLLKRSPVAGNFTFATKRTHDDGLFDVGLCRKVSPWKLISLLDGFEKKGLSGHSEVFFAETNRLDAKFDAPNPVDFDGEILFVTQARWTLLPKALTILG